VLQISVERKIDVTKVCMIVLVGKEVVAHVVLVIERTDLSQLACGSADSGELHLAGATVVKLTISLLFFNFYSVENEQEAQLQPPGAGAGCAVAIVRVVGMLDRATHAAGLD
jgi:hypothetical protein